MKITRTIEIQAPAEAVWEIVGRSFADIGTWATRIQSSQAIRPAPGAPPTGRTCAVAIPGVDAVQETLVGYDDAAMTLEYTGSGLPGFVTEARNRWTVEPIGAVCRVSAEARLTLTGWARAWALPMRIALTREGDRTLEDLRHFAEHGEPRLAQARPALAATPARGRRDPPPRRAGRHRLDARERP